MLKYGQIQEVTLLRKKFVCLCAAAWLLAIQTGSAQTLGTGMSGEAVTALQQSLTEAGYFARTADGEYGSATKKAVELFQKEHGLPVTGTADEETQRQIQKEKGEKGREGGGILLSEGNHGTDVEECQRLLAVGGYLSGPVDGMYGPATTEAVQVFQRNEKLPVSGCIDRKTMDRLKQNKGNSANGRTLARGDRGEAVRKVQRLLQNGGYLSGEIDGVYGGQTEAAVCAFQKEQGLTVTGAVDPQTENRLSNHKERKNLLQQGDRGPRVAHLQNLLTLHGFTPGAMDGIYGSGTAAKVREFQHFCGMKATGTVDEDVWQKLREAPVFQGRYKKVLRMQSTAYTPYDGSGTGRTASGNVAGKGHAAVDPEGIPLGSLLFIEGYGYALADDIGGGINGQFVDVGVDTLEQAYGWGNRRVNIYIVE